jgi:hypothetical protein
MKNITIKKVVLKDIWWKYYHFFIIKFLIKKWYGAIIFKKTEKSRDAELITFWNGRFLP